MAKVTKKEKSLAEQAEEMRLYKANHYQANKERYKTLSQEWVRKNKEKSRLIKTKWREKNREKENEKARNRKLEFPERFKQYHQKYEANNKSMVAEAKRKWRANNPQYNKQYLNLHPEKFRQASVRRRAAIKTNSTPEQIKGADKFVASMASQSERICPYCSAVFNFRKMHVEHIFPIFRGGLHDSENITMACSKCNLSKKDKILFLEWTPPNFFLSL